MKRRTVYVLVAACLAAAVASGAFGVARARSGGPDHVGMAMGGGSTAMSAQDMLSTQSHRVGAMVYHGRVTWQQRRAAAAARAAGMAATPAPAPTMDPLGVPDYFGGTPNYANSPTTIRKFVDSLPGLGPSAKNDLGQYIPVATPDTTTFPGSDYYVIAVRQYTQKLHKDLPATTLRGYVQINNGTDATGKNTVAPAPIQYLGPMIVAQRDRPVRVKFVNQLPTGESGNLFLPSDTTMMGDAGGPNQGAVASAARAGGAGTTIDVTTSAAMPTTLKVGEMVDLMGLQPAAYNGSFAVASVTDGSHFQVTLPADPGADATTSAQSMVAEMYTQNRAVVHLHGGATPWISDGTPHQWITPAGETTSYTSGRQRANVPDMWFDAQGTRRAGGHAGRQQRSRSRRRSPSTTPTSRARG